MAYQKPKLRYLVANQGRHSQYLFTDDQYFVKLWKALTPRQRETYNKLAQPFGQSGFILAFQINRRLSFGLKVLKKYNDGDITRDYALWLWPQLASQI